MCHYQLTDQIQEIILYHFTVLTFNINVKNVYFINSSDICDMCRLHLHRKPALQSFPDLCPQRNDLLAALPGKKVELL